MKTSKRIDEPTPNGGSYSVAYFRDRNGKPCSEKDAVKLEIIEYDENNNQIARTYC